MADMPADFWAGWIAVITIVSLLGLGWFVFSIYFSSDSHEGEESPVWDEALREDARPAPMWWFWLILGLMVFSVVYLMLYPGLGSFSGVLKWSQGGQLERSFVEFDNDFEDQRARLATAPLDTLRNDPLVMRSARRVFDRNCAACHGPDGGGQASHFPNLTDDVWQWGGSADQLEQSIRLGRKGVMPGWAAVLGDEGVKQVVQYGLTMGQGGDTTEDDPGKVKYGQFCVACHGATGTGNIALGAPNLTDDVWLYGNSETELEQSIAIGRNGEMPAFQSRLDDTQIRMLVAWLTRDRVE